MAPTCPLDFRPLGYTHTSPYVNPALDEILFEGTVSILVLFVNKKKILIYHNNKMIFSLYQ